MGLERYCSRPSECILFIIMADECVDSANKEELVLCLCWVDDHLKVHEELISLYQYQIHTSADTILAVIKDTPIRMNLNLNRCRGQCYDGTGAMAGSHKSQKNRYNVCYI